jgi:hypothetical protein
MNVIDRVYRGEARLWKVFWFGLFLPSCLLFFIAQITKELGSGRPWWLGWPLQTLVLLYSLWIAVGLWACAPNVKTRFFFWVARTFSAVQFLSILASFLRMLSH